MRLLICTLVPKANASGGGKVQSECRLNYWRVNNMARRRGLPAFDTPCSQSIDPLCQGVGARPA